MVIFTEHNEVIIDIADLREMLRQSYTAGAYDAALHPKVPTTFLAQKTVSRMEDSMRKNPRLFKEKG